jgi:nucleotide-binding universal stress UspA family protein
MGVILIGTDGSKGSDAAVRQGIELAQRCGAKVVVAAVAEPVPGYLGRPLWQEWVTEHHGRARAALERARHLAEEAGVEAEYELLEDDPAEGLAALAESRKADLVVVGTRGIGAVVGDLLGSVSSGVVRRSQRPVVVIRSESERRAEETTRAAAEAEPATV